MSDQVKSKSEYILIVEDDKGLNNLIQKKIQALDLNTEAAFSGQEVLEHAASGNVMLIILDYVLQDMKGTQVIESLAKNGFNIPFIVITGQGNEKLAVEIMKLGARDYVAKDSNFIDMIPLVVKRVIAELATIHESEEKFKAIFDNAMDGLLLADIENKKFLTGNRMIQNMLGYSEEEIMNMGVLDIHPEQALPYVIEQFERQSKGEIITAKAIPVKRKDSSVFYADINSSLLTLAGKNYLLGIFRDITEQRNAEKIIKQQSNRNEQILQTTMEGFILADTDGKIIDVNPSYCRMTGYSREELLNMNIMELEATLYHDEIEQRIKLMLKQGRARFETKHCGKDGRIIDLDVSIVIMRPEESPLIAAFFRDITENKRAEARETALGRILESSRNEIYIFNAETLQFIFVNKGARENLGYAMDELKNLTPIDMKPEYNSEIFTELLKPLRTGKSEMIQFTTVHLRKDKSIYPVEVHLHISTFETIPVFVAIIMDITERKISDEALKESEKRYRALAVRLQEVEETERKALALELHDRVGQTLTGLNINLTIIRSQLSAESSGRVTARLDDSISLLEETAERTRDVMAELRPEVLDDYGLIAAIQWYCEHFSRRTGIETVIQTDGTASRLPAKTENALFRICQEAMTNSAKHSGARMITISFQKTEDIFRLTIKDNGRGFDIRHDHKPEKDSGWGLLTMRERAQGIGGEARIESGPEKGTRVIIEVKI